MYQDSIAPDSRHRQREPYPFGRELDIDSRFLRIRLHETASGWLKHVARWRHSAATIIEKTSLARNDPKLWRAGTWTEIPPPGLSRP